MSRIPILLCTGHRLFSALLLEARAAVDEGDWVDVQACLAEFALRLENQMQAEESVLFPCLAGRNAGVDTALVQCRLEHQEITVRTRAARAAADAGNRFRCEVLLSQLFGRLSVHGQAEEQRLYPLMQALDAKVFATLAHTLRGVVTEGSAAVSVLPPDHRLH